MKDKGYLKNQIIFGICTGILLEPLIILFMPVLGIEYSIFNIVITYLIMAVVSAVVFKTVFKQ